MAAAKPKFTKRLSVRLGAVSSVVALGAIAIAQGQLTGDKPAADQARPAASATANEPNPGGALKPIPIPDEGEEGRQQSPAKETDFVASSPESQATQSGTERSSVRLVSAQDGLVVRGNDGDEAAQPVERDAQAAPAFDFNPHSLPEVPAGPQFDAPSTYSMPPTEAGGEQSPAAIDSPGSASPVESPQELDPRLRDAARSVTAGSPPPASLYGGADPGFDSPGALAAPASVYGEAPTTLAPPEVSPADALAGQPSGSTPPSPASAYGEPPATFSAPAASAAAATGQFDSVAIDDSAALVPSPVMPQAATPRAAAAGQDAAHVPGFEGDGAPGADALEGRQAPALTIEKSVAPEIQVGKETGFEVRIRNVGQVAAHDVLVLDRVPRGTRFVNATPQPTEAPDGQLMWQLGTLEPGDETVVTMNVVPTSEGEIGSVAQVLFQTHASVRTICTKPELAVQHTGPQRVLIGESVMLDITLSNPGTGAATGVVLEENVPEGLAHAAGKELEYAVGTLKPGESRRLQLTLKADKAGIVHNKLIVRGDGNLIAEDAIDVEVIAPDLQVVLNGPKLRYLEREATYEIGVANPGTAAAREVELVTYLPKGMKFVAADHKGQYEPQNHAVYWSLEELPPQQSGVAKLTLLPLETGEQKLIVEGRAEMGLAHSSERLVRVDGLAELQFSIADEADPIEIGSETNYVVTLTNSGSSAATNIRMQVGLPPELKPVGGDGPTRVVIQGTQLSIDTLARLGPGEQAQYKLRVRGLAAGPQRFQFQLVSDETPVPVTKEEITRVYSDN